MTVEELRDALTLFDPKDRVVLTDGQQLGDLVRAPAPDSPVILLPARW